MHVRGGREGAEKRRGGEDQGGEKEKEGILWQLVNTMFLAMPRMKEAAVVPVRVRQNMAAKTSD